MLKWVSAYFALRVANDACFSQGCDVDCSKGAPIHGTVHWSQFTPLLLQVFGPQWFESGTISVAFKNIVTHLQPVKAFIEKPQEGHAASVVDIWMEHVDGTPVLDGTASIGNVEPTEVSRQLARIKPIVGGLVFMPHPVGTKTVNVEKAKISFGVPIGPLFPFTLEQKLECITEYHRECLHGAPNAN